VAKLKQSPQVAYVTSPWTVTPEAAGPLISKDGKTGLIIAGIMGGTVGFAVNKHRQSMEQKKKQRLERSAEAGGTSSASTPNKGAPPGASS